MSDLVFVAVFIGVIVGACVWADWIKQNRKRRYQAELAQWQQNEYLRKIAENQPDQRQDSGA